MTKSNNKSSRNILFLVVILIFAISLVARLLKLIIDPMLLRDSVLYLDLVDLWINTGKYESLLETTTITPPLPLFIIKLMVECGFTSEVSGRSLSLFLGSLIPVLGFFLLFFTFRNIRLSLIGTLVFIYHPTLIDYSIQPLREVFYLFFLGLAVLSLFHTYPLPYSTFFKGGFLFALAFFCRYESLEVFFILAVILLLFFLLKKIKLRRAIADYMFFCLGFGITCFLLLKITDNNTIFISKILFYIDLIKEKY